MKLRWRVVVGVALVAFLVAVTYLWSVLPWSDPYSGVFTDLGPDFDSALLGTLHNEQRLALADEVPFTFETVSVFREYAQAELVEAETEVDIVRGPLFTNARALMIFCADGRVIDVHYYPHGNDLIGTGQHTFSDDAMVEHGRLVEPDGVVPHAACS